MNFDDEVRSICSEAFSVVHSPGPVSNKHIALGAVGDQFYVRELFQAPQCVVASPAATLHTSNWECC
jgi:hypothetical protein